MKPFRTLATSTAIALGLCLPMTDPAKAFGFVRKATPKASYDRPPSNHTSQWYVTPDGSCSYSRTQVPGYAVTWILIQNPHHIGQADVADHCPNTL